MVMGGPFSDIHVLHGTRPSMVIVCRERQDAGAASRNMENENAGMRPLLNIHVLRGTSTSCTLPPEGGKHILIELFRKASV